MHGITDGWYTKFASLMGCKTWTRYSEDMKDTAPFMSLGICMSIKYGRATSFGPLVCLAPSV